MPDDMISSKLCPKCGEIKPLEAFSKQKEKKYGLRSHCKICEKAYLTANSDTIHAYERARAEVKCAYNQAYYVANAEALRAYQHARWAANPEASRASCRAWRAANPEKVREYRRSHYAANADKIRAWLAAYRTANRKKLREYSRAYQIAHPDVYRASNQRRRKAIKANGGTFTSEELVAMRAAQAGICAYCAYQYDPDELTIDHIIPVRRGGRHEAANICLCCSRCNSSKQDKLLSEWIDRWYYHPDAQSLE